MSGQSAEINISNVEMDEFFSGSPGGGVINVIRLDSCYLSIKNSSFRNGNNYGAGGILCIIAKKAALSIQNSTIHNISSSNSGGAVYIQSNPKDYQQSTNPNRNFFVFLRIISSSFSYSSSGKDGGALMVFAEKLLAIIRNSSFLQCNATVSGGALFFQTNGSTTIHLHNCYFFKNIAYNGSIVHPVFIGRRNDSWLNVSISNVTFSENRLCSQQKPYGVVYLEARAIKIALDFKNTYFINNMAGQGCSIFIGFISRSPLRFVTLDNCIFRNNVGYLATVAVGEVASLTCKNSIFDSNGPQICITAVTIFKVGSNDSMIFITNTTFVNNSDETINAVLGGVSTLTITDSTFIHNKNIHGAGGTLSIASDNNQPINHCHARITRVSFQENIAQTGSVLSAADAEVVFTNCTFLNNFAFFQGGVLVSGNDCGSVNLSLLHSVFRQTAQKIVIGKSKTFMATSLLRLFSPHKLAIVNTTFDRRTISDDPLIFVPAAENVSIDNASLSSCPLGHKIKKTYYKYKNGNNGLLIGLTFACQECDYNFYSLQRGTARGLNVDDTFQCLPCPPGANCVPAIKSKTNYWGYHVSSNPFKLAFTICPFGYCKSPSTNITKYNTCQGKRTGVMCGMCSEGYTEALWSTYCTPVMDCNDHWFWILFLTLVFSMAIILVFKPPFVT